MGRLGRTIVAALLLLLMGAGQTKAATEVGTACTANSAVAAGIEGIVFPLANGSAAAPPARVPTAGVLTRWTVRHSGLDTFAQRLKVLRIAPTGTDVQVLAQSELQPIAAGSGWFPIRASVQPGDLLGLNGPIGALACSPVAAGDRAATTSSDVQPGGSEPFTELSGSQPAVAALVEPDADGDGHGDETQDGCPASAIYQGACPPLDLRTTLVRREGAILVKVRASSEAVVRVFGQVRWKVRQPKKRGGGNRRLTVGLPGGGERTVVPGATKTFRVALTKPVKRRLGRLTKRQALRPKLTIVATGLAAQVASKVLRPRLPGRKPLK